MLILVLPQELIRLFHCVQFTLKLPAAAQVVGRLVPDGLHRVPHVEHFRFQGATHGDAHELPLPGRLPVTNCLCHCDAPVAWAISSSDAPTRLMPIACRLLSV